MFAEVGPKIQSQPLNNLNFKEALEKRTELQLLFPEFNIVLQQIHTGYILEIQVSTPAEREKVLKHPHYKKFAPFITLEAVGVKDTAKKTTKGVQEVVEFARGDQTLFLEPKAQEGLIQLTELLPPWMTCEIIHVDHANRPTSERVYNQTDVPSFRGHRFAYELTASEEKDMHSVLLDPKIKPFTPYLHVKVMKRAA